MDKSPNFEKYSYQELLEAKNKISKEKYPERYEEVIALLAEYESANEIKKETNISHKIEPQESYILKSWRGNERLWKAYWLNFVLVNTSIARLGSFIVAKSGILVQLAFMFIVILALVWSIVSVWRCAPNVKHKSWGYIARAIAILGPVLSILYEFVS